MNRFSFLVATIFLTAVHCFPALKAQDRSFSDALAPFLRQHCIGCHGQQKQNGERRFDNLPLAIVDSNALADYQDILDQLNLGEMPPADQPQPTDSERRAVVEWLTQAIQKFHNRHEPHGSETILRRLNSREYRNTIRDLLHLNTTLFDPTTEFPRDQTLDHLDNVGNTLVTSGYLLQQYLTVAEQITQKAVYPLQQPERSTWKFSDNFRQQPEIDQVHRTTSKFRHLTLYDVVGADKHEGAYGPIQDFAKGVPYDGHYEIRLRAEAVNRQHPYDHNLIGTNPGERLRLGIVPGDHTAGPLHKPQPVEPLLAEIELSDQPAWYTVRVWLDAGYTPRFTFRNGLMDVRNLWAKLIKRYPDQFPKAKKPGIVSNRFNAIKFGKLPQIHIHEIEIDGPIIDAWPTRGQLAVLGPNAAQILQTKRMTRNQQRQQLTAFMTRAFRRPVREEQVAAVAGIIERRRLSGRTAIEAYCDGIAAVLCAPGFLYLEEPVDSHYGATALASRLSYFLWSSMPDDRLLAQAKLATAAQSHDERRAVIEAEVERLLDDNRTDAFINDFPAAWLALRSLGSQPPDRGQFREYFHYDLGSAMLQETRLFTQHMLQKNRSVLEFLDCDYTFVNRRLAEHYGLKDPSSVDFQKVRLTDRRRGGLLGQGSVLTVTANGIDTSPVVRGVWLLDNLLGTPPSPPPPDIEPLDPDIRGAKTIREQLEKHRTTASCNDCHRKIDPMGFALENFDAIGGWRKTYGKNRPIDATGQLPNGSQYTDIVGFKRLLLQQEELFVRALTTRLLMYAWGRQVDATDRPTVDTIMTELRARGNGFRDLVKLTAAAIE